MKKVGYERISLSDSLKGPTISAEAVPLYM